jgi:hypothetical protein
MHRGAVESSSSLTSHLLSNSRSRNAAHRRSLPALRRIAPGICSADRGGPIAFRAFPVHLPGETLPPTRALPACLLKKPSASLAHLPGALARVDFPPAQVLRCLLFGEVSALPESSPSRRQRGARAGVVLPACIMTVQVRGSASCARQGARSGLVLCRAWW